MGTTFSALYELYASFGWFNFAVGGETVFSLFGLHTPRGRYLAALFIYSFIYSKYDLEKQEKRVAMLWSYQANCK